MKTCSPPSSLQARAMWNGVPFRPRESEAPLTAPSEFALATIARASERQAFDQQIEEKWRAIEVGMAVLACLTYKENQSHGCSWLCMYNEVCLMCAN
eukprot:1161182-Pelagomonas_calceolata.AAC.15